MPLFAGLLTADAPMLFPHPRRGYYKPFVLRLQLLATSCYSPWPQPSMPLSAIIKLVYLYVAKVRCLNVYMSAKESVKNLMNDEIEMRLLLRVSPSYGLERREWHNAGWAFQRTVNTRIRTTLPYPGPVSRKSPQAAHLTTAVSLHRLRARLLLIDGMKVDCDAPLKVLSLMHVPEHSLKFIRELPTFASAWRQQSCARCSPPPSDAAVDQENVSEMSSFPRAGAACTYVSLAPLC